jgi:hypothetical protein
MNAPRQWSLASKQILASAILGTAALVEAQNGQVNFATADYRNQQA